MKSGRLYFAHAALAAIAAVPGALAQPAETAASPASTKAVWTDLKLGPALQWKKEEGGNDHFYQVIESPNGTNWADAQVYAVAHNGYLATISTPQENRFVFKLIDDPKYWMNNAEGDSCGPWLGAFKTPGVTQPDDGWMWVHGEGSVMYFNWGFGQPDNNNGRETRIHYYDSRSNVRVPNWNDCPPDYGAHGFVVEYGANPAPPPSPKPVSRVLFATVAVGSLLISIVALVGMRLFVFNTKRKEDPRKANER